MGEKRESVMSTSHQDPTLTQRLLGALVLVALGVIFLPLILDGRKLQQFEEDLIPPRPNDPQLVELTARLNDENHLLAHQAKEADKPDTALKKEEKKGATTTIEFPSARGWVVQVGAFAERSNAENLVGRLKEAGYAAYISRFQQKRQGRVWHRVYVGPFADEEKAKNAASALKRFPKVSPVVVVFDPLNH
ncbi:MAG: SPOR domain-containing protein [Gammaproteobacteria bacterium]|nr:MAG: SPOR domain-containing protein [Gammaproteobacteria bacterium]